MTENNCNFESQSCKSVVQGNVCFTDLIKNEGSIIEIPLIQRDYAQGRPGEERKIDSILNSIFKNLDCGNTAELGFIYGYRVEEKDKEDKEIFVPLDGQQRLTLLFLLYYYTLLFGPDSDNELKEQLRKFQYKMRRSTGRFLDKLLAEYENIKKEYRDSVEHNNPSGENETRNCLSKTIEKSPWFFPQWKRDPTIRSMLTVLDKIDERLNGSADMLPSLENVRFNFYSVEGLGRPENFYIKINSRGKPLSEFEIFRAGLLNTMKELKCLEISDNFKNYLDGAWTKIFWSLTCESFSSKEDESAATNKKDKNNELHSHIGRNDLFEMYYLSFIKNILVNSVILKENKSKEKTKKGELNSVLFDEITFDICQSIDRESCIKAIYYTLNMFQILKKSEDLEKEYPYFSKMLTRSKGKNQATVGEYKELALLYSITNFAVNKKIEIEEEQEDTLLAFKDWYRIMRNLILNSDIDGDNYREVLNSINEFGRSWHKQIETCSDFTAFFKDMGEVEHKGFRQDQFDEEKNKAEIICDSRDPQVKEQIIKAEKNPYFTGQITFVLYCAGGIMQVKGQGENQTAFKTKTSLDYKTLIKELKKYNTIIDVIFRNIIKRDDNKKGTLIDGVQWRRSLLSKDIENYKANQSVYPCEYGFMHTFIRDAIDGTDTWKYYLKTNIKLMKLVKGLLDELLETLNSHPNISENERVIIINEKLKDIACKDNSSDESDYRYWFMKYILSEDNIMNHTYWRFACNSDNNRKPSVVYVGQNGHSHYHKWETILLYLKLKYSEKDTFKNYTYTPIPHYWNGWKVKIESQDKDLIKEPLEIAYKDGTGFDCGDGDCFENDQDTLKWLEEQLA